MLNWLQIRHFAIANQIELEPGSGLNVITGETGAGKSIAIRALSQVLGQRADSSMVRHGCQRAEIEAGFTVDDNPAALELLRSLELDEDGECLLRRVISADSGSKAYINGRIVTATVLRQVGETLLDIHGQHEHQSLLHRDTQRTLLDRFAGISDQVQALQNNYHSLRESVTRLHALRSESAAAQEKLDFLKYQVNELEQFAPAPDEWAELHAAHQRIHHRADLVAALQTAEQCLFGEDMQGLSADSQLGAALGALERVGEFDPDIAELGRLVSEARTLVEETRDGLRSAAESSAFDEQELAAIEQRYDTHIDLARKHRVDPEHLFEHYQRLCKDLDQVENPERSEQRLLEEINAAASTCREFAGRISGRRREAARRLSAGVSGSMQKLAMEGGTFSVALKPEAGNLAVEGLEQQLAGIGLDTGNESVVFEVSTNAGMPSLPLARVASGGELSRISLAIQLILADPNNAKTLVFDEVDVGVGGKTAAVIGKMLSQLAESRQILCITHLPQVAAFGNRHFQVEKRQGDQVDLTVRPLDEAGRIQEIARMVGGEHASEESLAHAQSLLQQCARREAE